MKIEEYFGDWKDVLDLKEADKILKVLYPLRDLLCPSLKDVFRAFTLCSPKETRVVILGQDPYPTVENGKPVATGIAFANSKDTAENHYSPSLEVIRESVIDFSLPHESIIFDPSLEKWEKQGVLLLNTALSCLVGKTGVHMLLWKPFIEHLLSSLSRKFPGIVYVLLGNQAQSFERYISHISGNIIKARHPSWYARNNIRMPSEIWKRINEILIGQNGYGIQWYDNLN